MQQAQALGEMEEERKSLAHGLRALMANPASWPLPFAGDYLAFHAVFGDKLVIDIAPGQVTHQFPPHRQIGGEVVKAADYVLGRGSWQPLLERLDRSVIHREVADLLASGGDYRSTPGHAALVQRLADGKPGIRNLQPLDSLERIDCYFDDLNRLIASIRTDGYRRRPRYDGLDSVAAEAACSLVRPIVAELTESEIGMAVDADGQLIRVGPGNHRMAIARQLGLDLVPVECRLFHVAWVRRHMEQGRAPLQAIANGVRRIAQTQQKTSPGDLS